MSRQQQWAVVEANDFIALTVQARGVISDFDMLTAYESEVLIINRMYSAEFLSIYTDVI